MFPLQPSLLLCSASRLVACEHILFPSLKTTEISARNYKGYQAGERPLQTVAATYKMATLGLQLIASAKCKGLAT